MKWWSPCEFIGVGVYKWTWNSCCPSWDFDNVNLYMVEPIGVGGVGGVSKMRTFKRGTQRLKIQSCRVTNPNCIYSGFPLPWLRWSLKKSYLIFSIYLYHIIYICFKQSVKDFEEVTLYCVVIYWYGENINCSSVAK